MKAVFQMKEGGLVLRDLGGLCSCKYLFPPSHLIYRIFRSIRWDRESESHVNALFSYSHLSLERFAQAGGIVKIPESFQ
jgi:hypothetical protein